MLAVVAQFRAQHERTIEQYTCGDCYRFGGFLQRIFPGSVLWFDAVAGHVWTQIGEYLYDITGIPLHVDELPFGFRTWANLDQWIVDDAPRWRWRGGN